MEVMLAVVFGFMAFSALYIAVNMATPPITCPKCKQQAKIIEKGYDYHSEYYCSNCNYEYDFTKG